MSVSGLRISDPEACLRGQDRGRRKISLKEWVQRNCAGGILANNTRIMIYKSNWFLFSTRFKGRFFQYPVLVTLRSPLRPDQSSTRHSYGALRFG